VTYFTRTQRDVTEARLDARREVAETFAALLDDTARKMNSDSPEYDRQYLVEDLLSRGFELAKNYAADMPKLFPALTDSTRTPAYPLVPEHVSEAQENTVDLTEAIRAAWLAQTFDNGYPRHEHIGHPDERCLADIRSIFNHSGPTVRCGRYYGHSIHETDFENRSNYA
jgi:hypothetical protein